MTSWFAGPEKPVKSLVEDKEADEAPVVVNDSEPPPLRVALRAHPALGRGIRANKPIKAWLCWYAGNSGGADTAFSGTFGVIPNQDSSWASWQATFDEFKVVGAEFYFNVFHTTNQTVLPANSPNAIVVYDPTGSAALASVNAGMQWEDFSLLRVTMPTATTPLTSPMPVTKAGFCKFRAKIPQTGSILSNSAVTNSTGMWRPTQDATNYDWGAFQTYVSRGGTSAVIRIEGFVRMLVEFRVRR